MARKPERDWGQTLPRLQGHTIGIVDSDAACHELTQALNRAGYVASKMLVFRGDDGIELVERLMEGSQWGESAEEFLRQCIAELERGHIVICVEVKNDEEAAAVAAMAAQYGGRSVYHFGLLTDTRLTR